MKLETELTDAKSDLAKALISARRAERMAMQANSEKEAQVRLTVVVVVSVKHSVCTHSPSRGPDHSCILYSKCKPNFIPTPLF